MFAGLLLGAGGLARASLPPQLILFHGRVLTVDAHDSVFEALAIRDGKIIAVGTDQNILRLADAATQRIDLRGQTATPGLIDSHAHIAEAGVNQLYHVHLSDASTVAEVVRRVQEGIKALKLGEWLQGDGWDEGKLTERRYVIASDLDSVSPHNPVWLTQTTGHYGVANSAALRLAKISTATHDPPAGTIDRDARGVPTGVLKEAAQDAIVGLVPPPTAQQQRDGILKSLDDLHREGITAHRLPGDREGRGYRRLGSRYVYHAAAGTTQPEMHDDSAARPSGVRFRPSLTMLSCVTVMCEAPPEM
jgi:predicted amidohydrolase YtcJ